MVPWRKAQLKKLFVVLSVGLLFPKLIIQEICTSLNLSFRVSKSFSFSIHAEHSRLPFEEFFLANIKKTIILNLFALL